MLSLSDRFLVGRKQPDYIGILPPYSETSVTNARREERLSGGSISRIGTMTDRDLSKTKPAPTPKTSARLAKRPASPAASPRTGLPQIATRGSSPHQRSIDDLCINTIRTLAIDAVQRANSGHPGTPMALAPVVYTLWQNFLRFDPEDPIWPNRDRFVLSNGTLRCCYMQCCILRE